jgi:hypothetical protein
MTSRVAGQSGSRSRKGFAYDPQRIPAADEKPAGVRESAGGLAKDEKIESLLTDIVTRLDRIEEKIDENVYPPESAIKPEIIRQLKKAHADIKKGKGKTYNSIDDFFWKLRHELPGRHSSRSGFHLPEASGEESCTIRATQKKDTIPG